MAEGFDKKTLSEQDIRTKFITPAITGAGWDVDTQLREKYLRPAEHTQIGASAHRGQSGRTDGVVRRLGSQAHPGRSQAGVTDRSRGVEIIGGASGTGRDETDMKGVLE